MLYQTAQILVVASLLCYSAVDATLAFTAPLGVEWKAGTKNFITWVDNGDGKEMPATFDLSLLNGEPSALQLIANVASDVSSASGSYEWTIPTDLNPGQYVLRAGGGDGSYSPFFTITAPDASDSSSSTSSSSPSSSNLVPVPPITSSATSIISTVTPSATSNISSTSKSYAATVTVTITVPNTVSATSSSQISASTLISASSPAPSTISTDSSSAPIFSTESITNSGSAATPVQQNVNAEAQNGAAQIVPSAIGIFMGTMIGLMYYV